MHQYHRRAFAHESVADSGSVDLELPELHAVSLSALAQSCADRPKGTVEADPDRCGK
jgi:hypothetical protein